MSEDTDCNRRRRLRFRAWHRGTREMDFIMGTFADRHLDTLNEAELDLFERLIDLPDRDLFSWVAGTVEPPPEYRSNLLTRILEIRLKPDDYV